VKKTGPSPHLRKRGGCCAQNRLNRLTAGHPAKLGLDISANGGLYNAQNMLRPQLFLLRWEIRARYFLQKLSSPQPPGGHKPVDRWLGILIGLVGMITYLIPDKTPPVIVGSLVIMFCLAAHPVWNFWWVEEKICRRLTALVVISGALIYLGYRSWPRPPQILDISPEHIAFSSMSTVPQSNEIYVFRIVNNSDHTVYATEFDFIVDELTASAREITIDIPKQYRKPFGESGSGAEHFTDVLGGLCRTPTQHLVYVLSFRSLEPHESREVELIHTRKGKLGVSAKTGFYSLDPVPITIKGDTASRWFRADTPMDGTGCTFFAFLVDHQDMVWFNRKL